MYDFLISILSFMFIITIPVFLHELGHFIAAKSVGIKVEKFYIGFNLFGLGFKKKYKDTEYGIGLFPLGGYVKVAGIIDESLDEKSSKEVSKKERVDPNSEFRNKNTFQKLWFLSAGVIMNFILTIFIYFFSIYFNGIDEPIREPIINNSIENIQVIDSDWEPRNIDGPAYSSGLRFQDKIVGVYESQTGYRHQINSWNDLLEVIQSIGPNREISIEYRRSKEYVHFEEEIPNIGLLNIVQYSSIMNNIDSLLNRGHRNINKRDFNNLTWLPEIFKTEKFKIIDQIEGTDLLGSTALIGITNYTDHRDVGIMESFKISSLTTLSIIKMTANSLKGLVLGEIPISQLSGIVGIGQIAGDTAQNNQKPILALIGLMAFISANLGFINILPIPGLDGGHASLAIIEGIRRKELSTKTKLRIQMIGMGFIFLLFGFTIVNDLFKIFS